MNCVTANGSFVFTVWPDISRMLRIKLDVVRCMGVPQFIGVGHIAILMRKKNNVHLPMTFPLPRVMMKKKVLFAHQSNSSEILRRMT